MAENPTVEKPHVFDMSKFQEWIDRKALTSGTKKILRTLEHFRAGGLLARLYIQGDPSNLKYTVVISGAEQDIHDGIYFDFSRRRTSQWRFEIDIEDIPVDGADLSSTAMRATRNSQLSAMDEKEIKLLAGRSGENIEGIDKAELIDVVLRLEKPGGYARFMMALMLYWLEEDRGTVKLPQDLALPGGMLNIGICADASGGF